MSTSALLTPELLREAHRLGLEVARDVRKPTFVRHGQAFAVPVLEAIHWLGEGPQVRHRRFWGLWGVRLGLDLCAAPYDVAQEPEFWRQGAAKASGGQALGGARLARLIPTQAREWAERASGQVLCREPWRAPGLEVAYVLEFGRFLHALTASQSQELDERRPRWREDARAALFYESQSVRPVRRTLAGGLKLRTYTSLEGLGASRALLMPEFDHDAALAQGFFATPSADSLWVFEPGEGLGREEARGVAREAVARAWGEADVPVSAGVWGVDGKA